MNEIFIERADGERNVPAIVRNDRKVIARMQANLEQKKAERQRETNKYRRRLLEVEIDDLEHEVRSSARVLSAVSKGL